MAMTRASMRYSSRTSARHAEPPNLPTHNDDMPMEEEWQENKSTPAEPIRNFLVEKFLHLVRYNAERIYARLPDEVDIEDLMSVGLFGLMDAIEKYDLTREVKFETFCAPRISGAILDELRSMDWVPRLVRHRSGKVEGVRQKIEMETGRKATDDEIADRLNIDDEEFQKYRRDSKAVGVTSINRNCFQRRELRELITKGLSRAERLIVILYYYESMTMKEIGATLDLSESRVSQMHSSILARLKAQMQHRMKELEGA